MAARMASGQLGLGLSDKPIQITEILEDLDEAAKAPMSSRPQVLVVRVNSLHVLAGNDIQRLVHAHPFQQAIVLYNFGQEPVIAGLKMAGIKVRREPISNAELGELINSLLGLIDKEYRNFSFIESGMPVAGSPGSLAYRLEGSEGNITAKTGWIQSGYTIAGFMDTPDGAHLIFSVYNLGKVSAANRDAMDELVMAIYDCGGNLGNE